MKLNNHIYLFILLFLITVTLSAVNAQDNVVEQLTVDENITKNTNVDVEKYNASLVVHTDNQKADIDKEEYFKAKICDNISNQSINGVEVIFKFNDNKKLQTISSITNHDGIAFLNKKLPVGFYNIDTYIKNTNIHSTSSLTVSQKQEHGCCSFYLQISKNEGVAGFRRDETHAANLFIKIVKWHGRTAIKQYKTANSYFFHSITTSDGWMMGTGGADNPGINRAIEKLAGKMVKAGKIKKSYLKKIQGYERSLGIGHFAIKAPNGKYAIVWGSSIKTGKLKPGQYLSVPNYKGSARIGSWLKFSKNPVKAAIKVGATDHYGVNRRDITVYHLKLTTKNFKTSSKVKVYASNDNGHMVGRHTSHLKDNIVFKKHFISKNKLPQSPNMKFIGKHDFGNIDKLIKTQTKVNAPKTINHYNKTEYFKITIKNKKTNKPIKNIKIKVKIKNNILKLKTNNKGMVKIDTHNLAKGKHNVLISAINNQYIISKKSTITIRE